MVSKSQIKLISSLQQKKGRLKNGLFIVEGIKGIRELLKSHIELNHLFTSEDVFQSAPNKTTIIKETDLKKISRLKTPQTAVAIFKIPHQETPKIDTGITLALDGIRDPGNLGTIIRLCDWFGIKNLICSLDTVDCYNSKVVQATMGSIARIKISYLSLEEVLQQTDLPVLGTFLEGQNVYAESLPENAVVVMGNEANGISKKIEILVKLKVSIPQFGLAKTTESLNVATATAIVLSELKRDFAIGK